MIGAIIGDVIRSAYEEALFIENSFGRIKGLLVALDILKM